ncbi:hypothetical protein [Leifsonia sp. 22587]|uniref:hypothetical protein n=1 Tax=Leifsonia sp. 22587 TaxID=3453946 RepID=UPI003F86CB59
MSSSSALSAAAYLGIRRKAHAAALEMAARVSAAGVRPTAERMERWSEAFAAHFAEADHRVPDPKPPRVRRTRVSPPVFAVRLEDDSWW